MKTVLMVILIIIALSSNSITGTYQDTVVKQALKYENIKELTNKNDGVEIERWLKNVGLAKGNPYCQAFLYSMFLEVQPEIKGTMPLKTGRVAYNWSYAKKNPLKFKIITANQVKIGIYSLEAGDIPVWSTGDGSTLDFNGHTGLTMTQINDKYFKTIEGNTQSGNTGDQREGGGVYSRIRLLDSTYKFRLRGFIRVL